MATFQIYKNLARLNDLSVAEAESAFFECCGSQAWARGMTAARPFKLVEELYNSAETIWFSLTPANWLEAFSPKSQIDTNDQGRLDVEIDEVMCLYEERFGFIFVVCADGKSSNELLSICRARLRNSAETELQIAAEEKLKIIEVRLAKVLER